MVESEVNYTELQESIDSLNKNVEALTKTIEESKKADSKTNDKTMDDLSDIKKALNTVDGTLGKLNKIVSTQATGESYILLSDNQQQLIDKYANSAYTFSSDVTAILLWTCIGVYLIFGSILCRALLRHI